MSRKQLGKDLKTGREKTRLTKSDFTIVAGIYKANEITLNEVAINNSVVRIPLERLDILEGKDKILGKDSKEISDDTVLKSSRIIPGTSGKRHSSNIATLNRNKKTLSNMNKREVSSEKNQVTNVSGAKKLFKYRPQGTRADTVFTSKSANSEKKIINGNKQSFSIFSPKKGNAINDKFVMKPYRGKPGPVRKFGKPSYRLEFMPYKPNEDRILNYTFSKLAVDVRSLRLPASNWKIKIYMKNKAILSIAFTNKQEEERVLKFSSANNLYEIIIDNKKASLLGSPLTIDNGHDVETLLDIIHNISAQNPMIMYKA